MLSYRNSCVHTKRIEHVVISSEQKLFARGDKFVECETFRRREETIADVGTAAAGGHLHPPCLPSL